MRLNFAVITKLLSSNNQIFLSHSENGPQQTIHQFNSVISDIGLKNNTD